MNRPLARLRSHPTLAAGLSYAALALLLLAPGLLPGRTISTADSLWFAPPWQAQRPAHLTRISNNEVGDAVDQFQPFATFARDSLPRAPLWNPFLMAGRPLLADDQSAVLSPFTVPAYVTGGLGWLGWSAALKLFTAALGMFLLARALALSSRAAWLAGLVYGFNFWIVTWLAYPHSGVWALFGWVLWAIERVLARPSPRAAGVLGLAVGVQFLAGHAESSFDILVGAGGFLLIRAVVHRRAGTLRTLPALGGLGFGLVAGLGLAAAAVAPFASLLAGSADIQQRAGTAVDQHLLLRGVLELFLPAYWGRATQTPLIAFIRAQAYYAGALPLLLATFALAIRPRGQRLAIALLGFTGLAVAVGIPPFLQIVTRLPVFSAGHNSRLIPWTMVALALLAGWGLDDLRGAEAARRGRWALGAVAGVIALPVVWVLARREVHGVSLRAVGIATGLVRPPATADPGTASAIHLAAVLAWLGLAGAGLALIWLRRRGRLGPGAFTALALALTVLDLFHAGMGYNPSVPQADARQPATGAIRYLEAHRGSRFQSVYPLPFNVIAMRYHLPEAGGYDLPILRRYDRLWRTQVDPEHPSQVGHTFVDIPLILPRVDPTRLHTLRLLGVGHLLTPPGGPALHEPGLRLAYDGSDARVYAVDGAQPRAAVVGGLMPVSGAAGALRAVRGPRFDASRVVAREGPGPSRPAGPAGSARVVSDRPEQVTVTARAARPATLVLDDVFAPGWSARVDGREVTVQQVDYVLRGVALAPGRHTVVFRYAPASWRWGWLVSLVSLAAIAVALGWRRR